MRTLRAWLRRLTGPFLASRREREMAEEFAAHLQLHVDDNVRAGMTADEARRQALVKFGAMEAIKEQYRDRGTLPAIENVSRDLRYAVRMMRRAPGFTFVAVAALALGIGVNTTVFTAFEALALRPLDVREPGRLVRIYRGTAADPFGAMSYADYRYVRERASTMSDVAMLGFGMGLTSSDVAAPPPVAPPPVAAFLGFRLPQLLQGSARPLGTLFVSGNYFSMLGATPAAGRLIADSDDRDGAEPVVVVSGNFWQRHFHADPSVVGSTLHLNGVPFTVIGVTPLDYVATAQNVPDLWVPLSARLRLGTTPAQLADPLTLAGWVHGRMRPEAALADVQAELDVLARGRPARLAESRDSRTLTPQRIVATSGKSYAPPFGATEWMVTIAALTAVALLLLIACTNVASLLLARATVRRREIAVRLSLGAGRTRLLQQLLTESVLLGLIAGAAGLVLSIWMLRLLVDAVAASLPAYWGTIALRTDPDARVFGYALAISIATGIAFGLVPALQASRLDLNGALKADGDAGAGGRRRRLDRFVGMQIAACLLLLVCAALLLRSSTAALHAETGFDATRVVQLQTLEMPGAAAVSRAGLSDEDLTSIPGIDAVAHAARTPLAGARTRIRVAGAGDVAVNRVSPEYFATLGIGLVRGRTFTHAEADAGEPVAIISAATAARVFPGADPIGRPLTIGDGSGGPRHLDRLRPPTTGRVTVIGVAADVRSLDVTRVDEGFLYLPLEKRDAGAATFLRVSRDPAPIIASIGGSIGARRERSASERVVLAGLLADTLATNPRFVVSRMGGLLAALVASFGLVMAAIGVAGMVGYAVTQRTKEIGLRMALGARRGEVLRLIAQDGARPVAAGVAAGLVLATIAARALSSLLFGIQPVDPLSFLGAAAILLLSAAAAVVLPARRATRVDPMIALRHE